MKKYIVIVVFAAISSLQTVYACDACGGSLGAGFFGILPQFQSHFIGLRYNVAWFEAKVDYTGKFFQDEYSVDQYTTVDLMARYAINKKFQLIINVPYIANLSEGNTDNISLNGIGDPRITAYYRLLNTTENSASPLQHAILLGGGLKLPLGDSDRGSASVDATDFINKNVQLGTGSLDYYFSMVHTSKYQKTGIKTETAYKINSENSSDYRFGNQFNISTSLFQWIKLSKKSVLIPGVGLYYEQAKSHLDKEIIVTNTGGEATFLALEAQLYVKQLTFGLNYMRPLTQNYLTNAITNIDANDRLTFSLLYNIPSVKNPFKLK